MTGSYFPELFFLSYLNYRRCLPKIDQLVQGFNGVRELEEMHSVLFCFPSSATFNGSLCSISSSNRCSRQTISKPNGILKLSGMSISDSK